MRIIPNRWLEYESHSLHQTKMTKMYDYFRPSMPFEVYLFIQLITGNPPWLHRGVSIKCVWMKNNRRSRGQVFTIRERLNQIKTVSLPLIPFRSVKEKDTKSLWQIVRSQQGLQRLCLQDSRRVVTALFVLSIYFMF